MEILTEEEAVECRSTETPRSVWEPDQSFFPREISVEKNKNTESRREEKALEEDRKLHRFQS